MLMWFGMDILNLISNLLESLQIGGAMVVTGALKGTNRVSLLKDLSNSWVELSVGRKIHKLTLMYKMVFKLALPYLCDLCPNFVSERSTIIVKSVGKVAFFTSSFSSSPHPWPNVDQNVNVCARNCSVISQH